MKAVTHVFLLSIFILSSGFSLFSNEPSDDDIRLGMADVLPSYMQVTDIDIKAQDNTGSESSPRFMTRFTAEIELETSLYENVGWIGGDVQSRVVRVKTAKGKEVKLFGKATSVLKREKWVARITEFELEDDAKGSPLSKFNNPVVEGSPEHKEAIKKYDLWWAAEQARQAKEAKERDIRLAKEAKERKLAEGQRITAINENVKKIAGTWDGINESGDPLKMVVDGKSITVDWSSFGCPLSKLYIDMNKSTSKKLVLQEVAGGKPCVNSTDVITNIKASTFDFDILGWRKQKATLYKM